MAIWLVLLLTKGLVHRDKEPTPVAEEGRQQNLLLSHSHAPKCGLVQAAVPRKLGLQGLGLRLKLGYRRLKCLGSVIRTQLVSSTQPNHGKSERPHQGGNRFHSPETALVQIQRCQSPVPGLTLPHKKWKEVTKSGRVKAMRTYHISHYIAAGEHAQLPWMQSHQPTSMVLHRVTIH